MEPTTTLQEIHHHWKPITKPIATKPKSCNKTQRTFSVNKQGKNWLNGTNKQNSMKRKTQQIKFIWRFKPKSQLAIKNNDKKSASQLKILIQNKPSQSKYPLTKPPNSQISARKKNGFDLCGSVAIHYQPTHSKPIIADRNLTTHNPYHGTAINTTREKTQTLQHRSTPQTTTNPHHGAAARPRERECKDSNADPHQNPWIIWTTAPPQRPREREERVSE